ncbi:MAG: alanine--tRNA ligase-related protein [Desulfomicrobium escambiense]|nr:alanine--tRNA ligase-related protein [Desulfomicrobium escambiense]
MSRKGKEARLELGETRFHASGGGQPGDAGCLVAPGFSAEVMDCLRDGESVVLSARVLEGEPIEGLKVRAEVNLSRQALLSRMHSGEHVLSRVLESAHEGLEVIQGRCRREETTVFMHWDGELGWDRLFEAEERGERGDFP